LLLQFEWLYLSDDIVLVAEDVRNSKWNEKIIKILIRRGSGNSQ
jgi:hypothetical protein